MNHMDHEMDEVSLETYADIKDSLPSKRIKVVKAFIALGDTASAEQIADYLSWNKFHVMPRITELKERGILMKTGQIRKTRAGKSENIYELLTGGIK